MQCCFDKARCLIKGKSGAIDEIGDCLEKISVSLCIDQLHFFQQQLTWEEARFCQCQLTFKEWKLKTIIDVLSQSKCAHLHNARLATLGLISPDLPFYCEFILVLKHVELSFIDLSVTYGLLICSSKYGSTYQA